LGTPIESTSYYQARSLRNPMGNPGHARPLPSATGSKHAAPGLIAARHERAYASVVIRGSRQMGRPGVLSDTTPLGSFFTPLRSSAYS